MKKQVLVGYMHASFANGSGYIRMADVSSDWDIIQLSFAEPDTATSGNLHFNRCPVSECPNIESDADFLAAIKAKQAAGKKVLISIGGANGQVSLASTGARDAFVSSMSAIIDRWGLDGLDIDFEGHSIYLNNGDRDFKNPTTPVVVNLISALKTLKAKYGAKFVLTMAPETLLLHGGRMFYGSGVWGGADTRNGVYLPVIHAVRDFLTIVHAQHYNSGPVAGANGTYYNAGTIDFNVALSDMMITGFPIEGNAANFWPGLRPDQVGFGLPANAQAAGSGQMTPADTQKAFDCLVKGTNCGSYRPANTYPTFRALMTWSVNWDKFNNYEFSKAHGAYFRSLGN
jgi:chitinase